MRVTKLEKSKKGQDRVLVYVEGAKDPLRLTETEILRFGLYMGRELTEGELTEMRQAGERSARRAAAAHLASGRMVSRREVKDKLLRRGADEQEAEQTAQWLADLGAVDDNAYAAAIARHYSGMGYGPGRVKAELTRRGIPRELWDTALDQMLPADAAIDHFLAGKCKNGVIPDGNVKRLSDALARRGFSWNDIRLALRRWGREEDET